MRKVRLPVKRVEILLSFLKEKGLIEKVKSDETRPEEKVSQGYGLKD